MRIPRTPFWLLAALLTLPLPAAAQAAGPPCQAPEHRDFDFWIGEWEVYRPDGNLAGRNTITSVMGGCVLHESYSTGNGYHGESFNAWDAGRGAWHQTWVDNGGTVLLLDGGLRDGAMVLEGETVGPDGATTRQRITWTVLERDDDGRSLRVRQLWQASTDGGESWRTAFDGEYRRVGG